MATINVKFKSSADRAGEGTIYYQIRHDKRVRLFYTDYSIASDEWNDDCSTLVLNPKSSRKPYIVSIRLRIERDISRLAGIDRLLTDRGMPYTVEDLVAAFNSRIAECRLFSFMEDIISGLKRNGRIRTSETYKAALNSFRKFLGSRISDGGYMPAGGNISLDDIDSDTMIAYEAWLAGKGIIPNTISFYNRILRAVYNRAVEQGLIEDHKPFRHVYTGVAKTVKRALPLAAIKRIKELELSRDSALDYARDMFLMSFYLRGMSFVDMAYLKKTDLNVGYITYRRRKTGQKLMIAWTGEMQSLLDKYPANNSEYLLPIIRLRQDNERSVYRNVAYSINHRLKTIARMAGIRIPLTLYVARHSWASAAKAKGIPLSVISEGMGHDSEATTQIYLASLDTSVVDRANSIIIKSLS